MLNYIFYSFILRFKMCIIFMLFVQLLINCVILTLIVRNDEYRCNTKCLNNKNSAQNFNKGLIGSILTNTKYSLLRTLLSSDRYSRSCERDCIQLVSLRSFVEALDRQICPSANCGGLSAESSLCALVIGDDCIIEPPLRDNDWTLTLANTR